MCLGALACSLRADDGDGQPRFDSSGGAAGLGFLTPNQWGLLRSTIRNSGSEAVELLSTVQFQLPEASNVQFATRAWLPPRSVREVHQPVYLFDKPASDRAVDVLSLLIDDSGGERMLSREPGLVRLEPEATATAILADADSDHAISAVIAARRAAGLSKRLAYLSAPALPDQPAPLRAAAALVLAGSELELDVAQRQAIRQWLVAGGRLWIMLDRLPPDVAEQILGNDWPIAVVDRVGLTSLQLTDADGRGPTLQRQRDEPFVLTRIVAPTGLVSHRVAGWPAAVRFPVGRGSVLVTTLDAAAWWTPGDERDAPDATAALESLASHLREVAAPPLADRPFDDFVRDQIGYTVLGRTGVFVVLAVLPAAIVISAVTLGRRHRLEWVGAVAAAVAVVVSVVLVGMGRIHGASVPLTVASAQWVELTPGQDLAVIDATLSVYSPASDRGPLCAENGGVVWPDMTGQAGRLLRMVWTDRDHWCWNGLELPERAVRTAEAWNVLPLPTPASVTLRFGARGVEGQLQRGPFDELEDLVLATPTAAMTVRLDEQDRFVLTPAETLPPGEYVRGVTMNQTQRQRLAVYRRLLDAGDYPARPTLLAWGQAMELGLRLSIEAVQRHAALVAFPATIEPAAVGQRITVPPAFITFQTVRGRDNIGTTTLYNAQTREWIGNISQGATLLLRFQLPEAALPMRVESLTLNLNLVAADRTVEVLRPDAAKLAVVRTLDRPASPQSVELAGEAVGQPDVDGGVTVGVRVSEPLDPTAMTSTWRIDGVSAAVTGVVIDADSPEANQP